MPALIGVLYIIDRMDAPQDLKSDLPRERDIASGGRQKSTLVRLLSGIGAAGVVVCAIVVLVLFYLAEIDREAAELAPPEGVGSFSPFAEQVRPPTRLVVVQHEGENYFVWYGQLAGPLYLPSGPSCYLFDLDGSLIEWVPETGEANKVDEFLASSSTGREISIDEVKKLIRAEFEARFPAE